jgi:hypothetical protein
MRFLVLLILILLAFIGICNSAPLPQKKVLSPSQVKQISSAIYKIEGGDKTKYPYGIKSINVHGDKNKAKLICENTIKNNWVRWQKTNKQIDFLTFLSLSYCPPSSDLIGNKRWNSNIHKMVKMD